jgi:hypothetical protein
MTIASDDIKLLESAVMADVPEGGGGATGVEIIDGASNNVFPDTSTDDRAAGRFRLRKVFGAAHTNNDDLLLGASFVVLEPPEDPLVHLTLMQTPGWFDTRTEAKTAIEAYLVKGTKMLGRIQDRHFAGALLLQLYNAAPATGFPQAGETVVLRNPSGTEQYVRVLKTTLSQQQVILGEAVMLNICLCELDQVLQFDILGGPVQKDQPGSTVASVYSTALSTGVLFHGVKRLGIAAEVGNKSVTTVDGIYSPIVPANTIEEPLTDIYPLITRPSLSRTAAASVTLPATTLTLTAGTVLQLPTAVEPGTLTMAHGATAFTSNAAGELLQGTTVVGTVDHRARTLTMSGSAPSYGSASNTITLKPATVTGATAHSDAIRITTANQGLGWVYAFEPTPAPATLSVSYMAQGRWYTLEEDGSSKLSGADSSYGSGSLSFVTGSLALTLGALPDVGSLLIFTWGEADSARTATGMPIRAEAVINLTKQPQPGTLAFAWSRGATNYTATVDAAGVVTGPAQVGQVVRNAAADYTLTFSPDTLPDGPITVEFDEAPETAAFTNDGGGAYTLTGAPIAPGSARFQLLGTSGSETRVYSCYSSGTLVYASGVGVIGTINNTTGAMLLSGTSGHEVTTWTSTRVERSTHIGSTGVYEGPSYYITKTSSTEVFAFDLDGILEIGYLPAAGAIAQSLAIVPPWRIVATPPQGLAVVSNGAVFLWAGDLHFSRDGALFRGWNPTNGAATAIGSVSSAGLITLNTVASGASNAITWSNLAHDARGALDVLGGVFRVATAPIKAGAFQLQAGAAIANANSGGVLTGDFTGLVDAARGIVAWAVTGIGPDDDDGTPVRADEVTYNAVFLQYVPLDEALLGISTTRLPIDGKAPIYRTGGQVVIHNTLTTTLPNPLTKGLAYSLGRERIAAAVVRTAAGVKVSGALYTVDFSAGEITFPIESDLTGLDQPFTVYHRIEDELMVLRADISGKLDLVGNGITHAYPANTSFVSSKLRVGDLFARSYGQFEQATWSNNWLDAREGSAIAPNFNDIDFPPVVTNRGAITERWALIFTGTTTVRVIGEHVGQILDSASILAAIGPLNPNTATPYFTLDPLAFGTGWSVGNVIRFNTAACAAPCWEALTVLQGPATVASDKAIVAFRADVDA